MSMKPQDQHPWKSTGWRIGAIALFLLSISTSSASNARILARSEDPLVRIGGDYKAGVLTLDEWAILSVTAIRRAESLPSIYAVKTESDEQIVAPGRDATMILLEIRKNWDRLTTQTQSTVAQIMARPGGTFTMNSPGGFFKLHWDTTGIHAVPAADVSGNGIPDYVDKAAAYVDSTVAKHATLGFLMPPSDGGAGGDALYDVYFETMPYYGYAQPESLGPAPWDDATSYLSLHKSYLGFPPNSDPEGDQYGAMKATVGHEFHHAVQFGYDVFEYGWFMELDATYAEDVMFPLTHDNFNYLGAFFVSPAMSLMTENQSHEYSSFVWGKYLDQKFAPSLMRAVWEGARYSPTVFTALSDTLVGRYGWTQDSAFADFAAWNYCTGNRNDGLHHTDAANYPQMSIGRTHNTYPAALQAGPNNPGGYAASYVQFFPGIATGTLRVNFDGANGVGWGAYIIKSTTINSHQFEKIVLTSPAATGTVDIPNFQTYQSVALVAVNTGEFSSASTFQYSAQIISTYELSTKILTDTMLYSGATRQIQYQVKNIGPLSDVARITGTHSSGWLNLSFIDVGLGAGDSAIVNVPVTAPQGIPLGTSTTLTLKATSRTDTTKFDTKSQPETIVLQIGDVDFDGLIDISDLTALIAYMYLGGPLPQPVIGSGDFDCQPGVDISDLANLISYLYLGGPPCPCRYF
jgi:hypothetical protein